MHLKRGPFSTKDVKRVLKAEGWVRRPGGGHQSVWEHPDKPGKFPVSEHWTSLQISDRVLKGMSETCKIPKKRLLELLNGMD